MLKGAYVLPANQTIDIRNVDWPLSILNCKHSLNQMEKGEQMEILIKDNDVVENLIVLISQLPGLSVKKDQDKENVILTINKIQ